MRQTERHTHTHTLRDRDRKWDRETHKHTLTMMQVKSKIMADILSPSVMMVTCCVHDSLAQRGLLTGQS